MSDPVQMTVHPAMAKKETERTNFVGDGDGDPVECGQALFVNDVGVAHGPLRDQQVGLPQARADAADHLSAACG